MKNFKIISLTIVAFFYYNLPVYSMESLNEYDDSINENYSDDANVVIQDTQNIETINSVNTAALQDSNQTISANQDATKTQPIAVNQTSVLVENEEKSQDNSLVNKDIALTTSNSSIAHENRSSEEKAMPVADETSSDLMPKEPVNIEQEKNHELNDVKIIKVYPVLDATHAGIVRIKAAMKNITNYIYDFFSKK